MIYEYCKDTMLPGGKILLYFYASYNSECAVSKRVLETISKNNIGLMIFRINTTKFYSLKVFYKIHKIPSYVLLSDNLEVKRLTGNVSITTMTKWLAE